MNRYQPRADALSCFILLGALVSIGAIWWGGASASLQITIAQALIYVTATVGFYIFVGNSGVFSFGHVSFMMIGAYVGAILATPTSDKQSSQPDMPHFLTAAHLGPYPAAFVGGAAAAVAALIVSLALIRLSGLAASLTSFALLQIVYIITANWTDVTGGESGLVAIPLFSNIGSVWITAVGAIAVALLFQHSSWGRRLQASREDEVAARSLGIGVHRERRIAFVLSAFIMGLAGALYGQLLGALVPESLYMTATIQVLIMLVVGGVTSLSGAVCGALFISIVTEVLRRLQSGVDVANMHLKGPVGIQQVGLALIMLLALLLLPRGLTGCRELTWLSRLLGVIGDRVVRGRGGAGHATVSSDTPVSADHEVAASSAGAQGSASRL